MKNKRRALSAAADFIWDSLIVTLIAGLPLIWSDIFPAWMSLTGLPLIGCRMALAMLEPAVRR